MKNEEYYVETQKTKVEPVFALILIFLGWLGIDKFVYVKSFRKGWKYALVKLAYTIILLGVLWNIFDIIQYFRGKYEFDFRDYFK